MPGCAQSQSRALGRSPVRMVRFCSNGKDHHVKPEKVVLLKQTRCSTHIKEVRMSEEKTSSDGKDIAKTATGVGLGILGAGTATTIIIIVGSVLAIIACCVCSWLSMFSMSLGS